MTPEQLPFDDLNVKMVVSNIKSVRSGLVVLRERLNVTLDINQNYGVRKASIEQITSMIYLLDETLERLRSIEQVSFAS